MSRVLLILPPTAERPAYAEPPLGLLYTATALKKAGHHVEIIDAYRNYFSAEKLSEYAAGKEFDVVGFGGISTCYGYLKEASRLIRDNSPRIHLIAGGVLSSAHEIILKNTPVDVICMGEGERTAVNIVNRLSEGRREFGDIKGTAFRKGPAVVKNIPEPYIDDLDSLSLPDYGLIDMDIYAFDAMKDSFFSSDLSCREFYKKGMRCFNIKTARGCTNACSFCYRHFKGYRQHSVDYVIRHIKMLQREYNIHFFRFGDELFTRSKEWVMNFAKRVVSEGVSIRYIIHGVRTDNVDGELMAALRDSGCIMVFIGFESGSWKILEVMKKNVTVERNIAAVRTIIKSGLKVFAQCVLGMPGEDELTVAQTAGSLSASGVEPEYLSITYAQAYPGTWLWEYALRKKIIIDPERYLINAGKDDSLFVNFTVFPDRTVKRWKWMVIRSLLASACGMKPTFVGRIQMINPLFYRCVKFLKIIRANGFSAALRAVKEYFGWV